MVLLPWLHKGRCRMSLAKKTLVMLIAPVAVFLLGMDACDGVASVTLNEGDTTLVVGETRALTVTVVTRGAADRAVTWSSSDTDVATVSQAGSVTGHAEGVTRISVASVADRTKQDTITATVTASTDPIDDPDPGADEVRIMIPPDRSQGLLFYIETTDVTAYYYGTHTPSLLDVTHMSVHPTGRDAWVVMFDERFYPIHWMLADASFGVMSTGNPTFDPSEATIIASGDDCQTSLTVDVSLTDIIEEIIGEIVDAMVGELAPELKEAKDLAEKFGVLHNTFSEVVDLARTGPAANREPLSVLASFVSVGTVGSRIMRNLPIPGTPIPIGRILGDMLDYMNRIADGYYDGSKIDGPTIGMLLCRGQSIVPQRCNWLYFSDKPSNLSKCLRCCSVTLRCFVDICHPIRLSVGVVQNYRANH